MEERSTPLLDIVDVDEESYDAIVVGSGYGGSVAACRLSMAGTSVCLIEKGRRWAAEDFPTNSFSMLAASKLESSNWGASLGSDKALFQIYEQGDSLCCVPCGLGGGSLINAGVLAPTPVRTRRNPKWPKEWNKDWEICEATASAMLGSTSIPMEFSNAKAMKQIAEEEIEHCRADPIKLTINFGREAAENKKGLPELGSCVACGNCLSGCPYNAKNSTDKNYLALAIQAGCMVKTEREVQYITKTRDETSEQDSTSNRKPRRRWRVYFDSVEYASADFVVLSAGVLGTTEILFQSERRGLNLSTKLGYGFSCNGNTVAYIAGSHAPLNAYGLNRKQFPKISIQERPGPAISSSYTSSLGFTIQTGVLPISYPYLLFKGIATYGWPNGCWFLHGLVDKLKHLMGVKGNQAMALNVMGYDSCDGRITLDKETEKISFVPSHDPLLPRKIQALQNITKRLGGILFMSRYRSASVHLLGGCNAAPEPSQGVCNPKGQVFNPCGDHVTLHDGLYVCDASLIPCSVGINPILTITAAAERISKHLLLDAMNFKSKFQGDEVINSRLITNDCKGVEFVDKAVDSIPSSINIDGLDTGLKSVHKVLTIRSTENVTFKETLKGYIAGMPCAAHLTVKINMSNQKYLKGKTLSEGEQFPSLKGKVGGHVAFLAINKEPLYVIDGQVDLCAVNNRTPYMQYMYYRLVLASASGSRYLLEGKKVMNPYLLALYAWKESRTLHVTFGVLTKKEANGTTSHEDLNRQGDDLKGELHLSAVQLLRSLISMKGKQRGQFVYLLLQTLWRTYVLQTPREPDVSFKSSNMAPTPYPPCILHELKAGDGFAISCRQWKQIPNTCKPEGVQRYPVLLLNGYSAESFWLPTESTDLVRTLLEQGHEIWILQSRVHHQHASNNFTIEDIAKFDIPAAINKICELQGPSSKIHVIAHCLGGLAIHIALLGGYVSAAQIVSLSCVNSSMFFKLLTSALVKMRLPLIPVSMAILGTNKVISMFDELKESWRHRLFKSIARLIPRYERCTLYECNLFSGIFGNAFWHENVSPSLHQWLNKQSVPRLPLSAFPHLRKICTAGYIVDPKGENKYLIHPERMALPTLYVSGGRTLLVTPETTFLAHNYMRLHQPTFQHKRVVVDGFGHSDLLIGEEAHKKVFPHFISHIRTVEEGVGIEEKECKGSFFLWDGTHDGSVTLGTWSNFMCFLMLLISLYFLLLH